MRDPHQPDARLSTGFRFRVAEIEKQDLRYRPGSRQ